MVNGTIHPGTGPVLHGCFTGTAYFHARTTHPVRRLCHLAATMARRRHWRRKNYTFRTAVSLLANAAGRSAASAGTGCRPSTSTNTILPWRSFWLYLAASACHRATQTKPTGRCNLIHDPPDCLYHTTFTL